MYVYFKSRLTNLKHSQVATFSGVCIPL